MTTTTLPATTTTKTTTQLTRGDLIRVSGVGTVAVERVTPYGEQAIIHLAWDNLAVICGRNDTWQATSLTAPIHLHGYARCEACKGKGIVWD